jgi:hypothetical protein
MDASKQRKQRIPKLTCHKASGQGFIRIEDRAIYFGKFDLPETQQKYHQYIAEWMASGCKFQGEPDYVTVREIYARFIQHSQKYYVKGDGRPTSEIDCLRSAIRPLVELYGYLQACRNACM